VCVVCILAINVIPNRLNYPVTFKVFTNVAASRRIQPVGPWVADP